MRILNRVMEETGESFEDICKRLEDSVKKINEQTKKINEIDRKIAWKKANQEGVAEYYDSKKSGDYTGD